MLSYSLRKTLYLLASLFLILTTTFFLMKSLPGNPFEDDKLPKEMIESLKNHYHLNEPVFKQYITYIKNLFHGHLGPSYIYLDRNVEDIIMDGFPISLLLGIQAILLALIGGVFFGTLSAIYRGKWIDTFTILFAVVCISVPGFLFATFLQYLFSMKFHVLPIAQWGTFSHTIMPTIALAVTPMAFIARLLRSKLIETLHEDYITAAYAKGLSKSYVMIYHALPNAILPVVSYLGPIAAQIITGSFVIEKIFGIPGIGKWLTTSISNRDYTTTLGITLFYGSILILLNYLVDIIYMYLDPRIDFFTKKEKDANTL